MSETEPSVLLSYIRDLETRVSELERGNVRMAVDLDELRLRLRRLTDEQGE